MDEQAVAEAVKEWVESVLEVGPSPKPLREVFPHHTSALGDLPNATVKVLRKFAQKGADERFQFSQLQQRYLKVFDLEVNFMVDVEDGGGGEQEELLRSFSAELEEAFVSSPSLGDRVQMASCWSWEFDYSLPFVEYPDGTRGRQMEFTFSVAELLETAED